MFVSTAGPMIFIKYSIIHNIHFRICGISICIFILPAGPDFVFPVNAKKKKEMKIESEKKVQVSFFNLAEKKILLRRLA